MLKVAAVKSDPSRKKSESDLKDVQTDEMKDRKPQEERIIESAFLGE